MGLEITTLSTTNLEVVVLQNVELARQYEWPCPARHMRRCSLLGNRELQIYDYMISFVSDNVCNSR